MHSGSNSQVFHKTGESVLQILPKQQFIQKEEWKIKISRHHVGWVNEC